MDAGHPGLRAVGAPAAIRGLWERLEGQGARPVGEDAWEVRRVERGRPLAGRELTEEHNPWEARLGHTVHPDKGCYIGQEVIARLDAYDKVKQRLVGLRWTQGGMPDPGTTLTADGREVGHLTSVARSAHLRSNLALAYLRRESWDPGTRVGFGTAAGHQEAEVSSLPFAASA